MVAADSKDSSRGAAATYEKAKGRLKEERRALKLLASQAVEERGSAAVQTLVGHGPTNAPNVSWRIMCKMGLVSFVAEPRAAYGHALSIGRPASLVQGVDCMPDWSLDGVQPYRGLILQSAAVPAYNALTIPIASRGWPAPQAM